MKKDTLVTLTKLKPLENPEYPTPNKADYRPGQFNGNVSLPIDYTATGILLKDIEVGEPILMFRHIRNGIKTPGHFSSSRVSKIEGNLLYTNNSIYKIEILT
jgi:hypothetical protein